MPRKSPVPGCYKDLEWKTEPMDSTVGGRMKKSQKGEYQVGRTVVEWMEVVAGDFAEVTKSKKIRRTELKFLSAMQAKKAQLVLMVKSSLTVASSRTKVSE